MHTVNCEVWHFNMSFFFLFLLSCVTWRLKRHKEVIIVLQKMAGRKNLQQPRNLQQQPTTRPLPIQPSSDMSNPGAAPWQSVVLGENVAYSKGQEPPPPSYEEVKDNKKADPEYAYIDNQRVLTTSKV